MRTTIEMAREAAGDDWGLFQEFMPEIHRLAELVRADERARMAEQPAQQQEPDWLTGKQRIYLAQAWAMLDDYALDQRSKGNDSFANGAEASSHEIKVMLSTPQPAQQEPVAKVCHDLDGHIGWNPNLRQLPDEGTALYTSPPTLSLAQRPHECSRSHPHENMNAMCELRTEIARLTNENARLKALHQGDEINTYRMTLLCIRDGLQQGMSKSIQKLQAREINDVLGLPSFASYRTSPPAQRTWVGLTDEEKQEWIDAMPYDIEPRHCMILLNVMEVQLKQRNT